MMLYTWFNIFNLADFLSTDLTSRTYSLNLDGIGLVRIHVTKGNLVSITYAGILLSINMNGANPFEFEDHAVYLDENDDVWLGIKADET